MAFLMPCYHPLDAWRLATGDVVFVERGDVVASLQLPCGQCVGCRLERSRQWAVRCMHEASLHDDNCFITLTYANISPSASLDYRDFQLFIKRLRKSAGKRVRFYMCGEYGEEFNRPHFHACIFGYGFPDRTPFRQLADRPKLFRSALLERLWPHGFASIGDVTFESAAYVARYVMKKVTGKAADDHYRYVDPETGEVSQRVPEFNHMSLKPGIGAQWLDKYASDVYPSGKVVSRGHEAQSPRYYDKRFKKLDPEAFDWLMYEREVEGRARFEDSSPDRLAVREVVTEARVRSLKRSL